MLSKLNAILAFIHVPDSFGIALAMARLGETANLGRVPPPLEGNRFSAGPLTRESVITALFALPDSFPVEEAINRILTLDHSPGNGAG